MGNPARSLTKMKTYEIPAEHAGMSEVESRAISAFEQAHKEHAQSCIGHELRRQRRAALSATFAELERLNLVSALTWKERADARNARSMLG